MKKNCMSIIGILIVWTLTMLNTLNSKDILSIVSYETEVQIPVSSQKVQDKKRIMEIINSITTGGNTLKFN